MHTHRLAVLASSVVVVVACSSAGTGGSAVTGTGTGTGNGSGTGNAGGNGAGGAAASGTGGAGLSVASSGSGSGGATSGSAGSTGGASGSTGGMSSASGSSGSLGGAGGASTSGSGGASTATAASSSSGGPLTFGGACSGATTALTGTVFAPNGTDPIPNVRVYAAIAINPYPVSYCDKCSAPIDPAYVSTVSAPDGTYTLPLDSVPDGATVDFAIQIGRFRKHTNLPVTPCQTQAVPAAAETLPGSSAAGDIPKIAVAAGTVDHLDTVLTALGITEFDCYEGRPNPTYPYGGTCALTSASKIIADELADPTQFATIGAYHMAFISCAPGAYAKFTAGNPAKQAAMTTNTQQWVAGGGRLFVTDTAYDYIAQPFGPNITWAGPAGTPQPIDGANIGCAPAQAGYTSVHTVPYAITVDDPTLAAWLKIVGFPASPNVSVNGFYEPWSAMSSLPATSTLIANGIMPLDPTITGFTCTAAATQMTNVPLTAQFDVPSCGRVIFSSYHTYQGTGSTAANQKIMEYLIFDAAYCHS